VAINRINAVIERGRIWFTILVAGGAFALLPACVTSSEGHAMKAESSRLKERLDAMDKRYTEANMAMDRIRQVLDEATALLSRNSADLGAQVERQGQDVNVLKGKLEEVLHLVEQIQKQNTEGRVIERLAQLEQGQQKIVDKVAPSMPEDKDGLWNESLAKLKDGNRTDGRRFLREYLKRFPQDPKAPVAYLLVGKSFAEEAKHTQAAAEYQKVLDTYPKAPEVPEAMFQLGASFVELKFCGDAEAIFLDIQKRFKKSPFANEAKTQAKAVKLLAKDKTRCTS
jgi:TolA-binding protein